MSRGAAPSPHEPTGRAPAARDTSASHDRNRELVEGCQGLVRSLAWKIHQKVPPTVDLEDLIAFGQVGLAEAARDFDPEKGVKFITYAYHRIRGGILDGLSKMSWFSRRDFHASRYEHKANAVLALEDSESREDVDGEVRWFRGLTTKLAVAYLATSGGDEAEGGGGIELEDRRTEPPPDVASQREVHRRLHDLISELSSDSGELIRAVYFEGLTIQEAGKRLGISKAWASRLHARTLERLGRALRLLGVERP